MEPITATIITVVIFFIITVVGLLAVTKKAYNHKWDTDDNSGYPLPEELQDNSRSS